MAVAPTTAIVAPEAGQQTTFQQFLDYIKQTALAVRDTYLAIKGVQTQPSPSGAPSAQPQIIIAPQPGAPVTPSPAVPSQAGISPLVLFGLGLIVLVALLRR